ncbi:hypothetical protein Lalb_Chr20g0110421 [Lupinus albus]|uniref:Uncharacterized protein n=1 Tax=Lupinus albus TaxID=3870 RepID=A0A6A4NTM2_LUPAL|nr:hypothetical protein Lalb_Chr20g0110421 [Lupinus albus]
MIYFLCIFSIHKSDFDTYRGCESILHNSWIPIAISVIHHVLSILTNDWKFYKVDSP